MQLYIYQTSINKSVLHEWFTVKTTAVFIGSCQQAKQLQLELDKMVWAEKKF